VRYRAPPLLLLANVLFLLSAALTVLLVFSAKGTGPEGPVGAHMLTAPLALMQAAALALVVGRGDWDFLPVHPGLLAVPLIGYVIAMTILPFAALGRGPAEPRTKAAVAAALAGGFAALDGAALVPGSRLVQSAGGVVVALVGLGGWLVVGAFWLQTQRNAIRKAEAESQRMSDFEKERAAYDQGEFSKLPADAGLWQLIQFSHSFHPEVRRQCHERIAARPDLERDMIELLGTGWAPHAQHYLRDFYPLPHKGLAPAIGTFLDQECARWEKNLAHDSNPGSWEANMSTCIEVAARVMASGGDVRAPLERWAAFLGSKQGLGGLAARVREIL
jgi:hypothetical protein